MAGIRIGGLASGMDIDTMVKDLMKAERIPLDKYSQKKQKLEWQRDQNREINKLLYDFRTEAFNMRLQSTFQVKNASSTNETKVVASAQGTASGSFKITSATKASNAHNVSGSTISGTTKIDTSKNIYDIKDNFEQGNLLEWDKYKETIIANADSKTFELAKENLDGLVGTQVIVTNPAGAAQNFDIIQGTDANPTVASGNVYINTETGKISFGDVITKGSSFNIGYDFTEKEEISVENKGSTFFLNNGYIRESSLPASIEIKNSSGEVTGTYNVDFGTDENPTVVNGKVYINTSTGKMTFGSEIDKGSTINVSYKYHYFTTSLSTYKDGGEKVSQTFEVKGNQSLNDFFNELNTSDIGVTSFYDSYTDKMIISRKETGDFNVEEMDGGDPPAAIPGSGYEIEFNGDIFMTSVLKLNEANEQGGTDADFTINGLATKRHSNTFDFNGVSFTIKDNITADNPVEINISNNTDKVYENIKGFIDKYNELIFKVNAKLVEPIYKDYQPLTDLEREDLSETQIEKWEEKAKSGLLKGDSLLTGALSSFRNDFANTIGSLNDTFNSMFDIGLSTGSFETRGRIIIDEDKLKEAISNNPEDVMAIFTTKDNEYGNKGIANRLYDSLNKTLDRLSDRAGSPFSLSKIDNSLMGKSISNIEDQMDRFKGRLTQVEDRYWRQFTAMEKAIQQANSQATYLAQLLSQ